MLNKTMITLAATIVLGSASVALAIEDIENRLGDKYPFLEQVYQPISGSRQAGRYVMPRQVATLNQYTNEVPENKIGDRYPLLELAYQPTSTSRTARSYVMPRQTAGIAQYGNEVPENKIGDRYPLLEAQYVSQRTPTRTSTARRELSTRTIR